MSMMTVMTAARVRPCFETGVFENTKPLTSALKRGMGRLARHVDTTMIPYELENTMGRKDSPIRTRIATTPLPTGTRLHKRAENTDPTMVPTAIPTFEMLMSKGSVRASTRLRLTA
jgi:hypothetical protein